MVMDFQVAEFVHDYVVDAVNWRLDLVNIQRNVAGLCAAAPASFHGPDGDLWCLVQFE